MMFIIVLVHVTLGQVQKSNQIKMNRAHEQSQLNELKSWLGDDSLRLIAQNQINQSYQDLMQNSEITQQPNMAWLRLMVEDHGLQFVDFKKIQSNQVSLDIGGSENEFWNFINHIKIENPWIRLKHLQLSLGSKKFNHTKYSKNSKNSPRHRISKHQRSSELDFKINELDKNYYTQLTTNGSRTLKWWSKLLDNYDNLARVAISTHLEFASLEHIFNVGKLLHKRTNLTLLLLADQKNFHLIQDYADKFKELECSIFVKPIRGLDGLAQEYTDEQKQFIKTLIKTLFYNYKNIIGQVMLEN